MNVFKVIRFAMRYWRTHVGSGLVLFAVLLVQQSYGVAIAYALKRLVDDALPQHDVAEVVRVLLLLGVAYLVTVIATIISEYIAAKLTSAIMCELRVRMFEQLQRLSLAYHSRVHSGDVIARFSADLAEIEKGVTMRVIDGVMSLIGLFIYIPFLFVLDQRLAAVVVLCLPIVMIGGRRFSLPATRWRRQLRRDEAEIIKTVAESTRSQPVIKAFDLAKFTVEAFRTQAIRTRESAFATSFLTAMVGTITSLGVLLFQGIVIAVGAILSVNDSLAVGTLVAFVALHASVSKHAYDLSKKVIPSLISAGAGVERIEELLDEPVEIVDRPGAFTLDDRPVSFRLENVSFEYVPGQPCIIDVSLEIEAGANVAFVGPSGSGKSTALKFMLRFHDPQSGTVMVSGYDIKDVSLSSLHKQIGAVFQDPLLIGGSVRENIRLGKLDATDAEIEDAARDAQIHDAIIAMPNGYDTLIGESGGSLSGGQRQRIAIARALVRRPSVLVLDEATSALDAGSENAIQDTIAHLSVGRTVISVTHRLARTASADKIFVFEHGKLVEAGKHDELVDAGGVYAGLWRKQSGIELDMYGPAARVEPEWLREIPLFRRVPETVLARIANELVFERLDVGRVVFEEGDVGDKFYILARGKAEVVRNEDQRIAVLSDGDFFGEIALVNDAPRNATVRTLTNCSFLTLAHSSFDKLLEEEEDLRNAIRQTMGERMETR